MKTLKAKLKPFLNFYLIVGGVALVWMMFFDLNSVMDRLDRASQIRSLEKDLAFYKQEKTSVQESRFILESDADELERFARERYRMKKPDETLFVIVETEKAN